MATPHYFIAIPLPTKLKESLALWQDELKKDVNYKQWPHVEDLHITLKFLGAVEENQLTNLANRLDMLTTMTGFQTNVTSIGTFGKPERPRVLWAGVEKTEKLQSLQAKVDYFAELEGFSKENRPYRPHITLAKKWVGPETLQLTKWKERYSQQHYELPVNEVVIYQILPSNKPKYKAVRSYQFLGENEVGTIN